MPNQIRQRYELGVRVFWFILAFQFIVQGALRLLFDGFNWFYIAFIAMGLIALLIAIRVVRKQRSRARNVDPDR